MEKPSPIARRMKNNMKTPQNSNLPLLLPAPVVWFAMKIEPVNTQQQYLLFSTQTEKIIGDGTFGLRTIEGTPERTQLSKAGR
jgi:hypothetical protein